MNKQKMVVVLGSNLLMATIGKNLEERAQLQVHQIEGALPNISGLPDTVWPDVIIFDLATAPNDLVVSLLREHPLLTMIGVDIENSRMLVLSGEQFGLMTTDDLVKAIEKGHSRPCYSTGLSRECL